MGKYILYVENQEPLQNPGVAEISNGLDMLDGNLCTLMQLTCIGKGTLMAIGGNSTRTMVTFIPENMEADSPSLVDPTANPFEEYGLTFEGESMLYSAKYCVSKKFALRAFDSFLSLGDLDRQMIWQLA